MAYITKTADVKECRYFREERRIYGVYYSSYAGICYGGTEIHTLVSYVKFDNTNIIDIPESSQHYNYVKLKIVGENGIPGYATILHSPFDINRSAGTCFNEIYNKSSYDFIIPYSTASQEIIISVSDSDYNDLIKYGITIRGPAGAENFQSKSESRLNLEISTQNASTPGKVLNISPSNNSILISNEPNAISWSYSQPYNFPQKYLSIDAENMLNGEKTTLVPLSLHSEQNYTMPAGTLPNGTYKFYITALPDDAYSNDANSLAILSAQITYSVRTNPSTGNITCNGKPMPTITWEQDVSVGQRAFQIRLGGHDTGIILGEGNSYTIKQIFEDGNYPVTMRVANDEGVWSDWGEEVYVNIKNNPPNGSVSLEVSKFNENAALKLNGTIEGIEIDEGSFDVFVYKNGKLFSRFNSHNTSFTDTRSNGTDIYQIKCMYTSAGYSYSYYYLESGKVAFTNKIKTDVISSDGGFTWEKLKYAPAAKTHELSDKKSVSYQYFAGRSKPIAIINNQSERILKCSYVFKNYADSRKLLSLEGEEVLLKTTRGEVIKGIANNFDIKESRLTYVEFDITETDEVIGDV